ncbi:MAG: tetratricopeptide repeat protein [SAR324 cluster bacterium]|nr:tetratricopeptide repeat protein [SAR324 cluster bacterium]
MKKLFKKFLHKLSITLLSNLFFGVLVLAPNLQARESVGVFSVDVSYPSDSMEWLGLFLQEEISLQLQLANHFSVISPDALRRWNTRIQESSQLTSASNKLQNTKIALLKPHKLLKFSVQKVLSQLAVSLSISNFDENNSTLKSQSTYAWSTPDDLVAALLRDLKREDPFFEKLTHFSLGYSWEGVKRFYLWRLKPVPVVNSSAWQVHKEQLEAMLSNFPEMAALTHFYRAVLLIIESSSLSPVHVPTLNKAKKEILTAIKQHPGNAEHHTLLSLLHYLRNDPLFAKQEANIAYQLNPGNGIALIIYGLTIGKTPQDGDTYVKKGLRLYPFVADQSPDGWQVYQILVRDLAPWLLPDAVHKSVNYKLLMQTGQQDYDARRWKEARQAFEDASRLEPSLAEPQLFLAKLLLAQQDAASALQLLAKLKKQFSKHPEINLYFGYTYEKLKQYQKAEKYYRLVLQFNPEHHKALLRLGAVLVKLGKHGEARSFLESLTRKFPLYTVAWWNLGILYYQLGELGLAESAWQHSLRLEPDNNHIRLRLEQLREEISYLPASQ